MEFTHFASPEFLSTPEDFEGGYFAGLVLGAVGVIAIVISVSDFLASGVAFTSAYTWFHL
jgi:hypothetical protein